MAVLGKGGLSIRWPSRVKRRLFKLPPGLPVALAAVLALTAALIPVHGAAAAGASVLVVAADSEPTQFMAHLAADPGIAAVTYTDASATTPSAQDLAQYDAVVVFDNFDFLDPSGLGDSVATYLDNGGTVVAFQYDWCGSGFALMGRWLSSGYSPFDVVDACVPPGQADHFTSYSGSDPLMSGVGGLAALAEPNVTVAQGATLLASWDDGLPLVATKGRAIAVNAYVGDLQLWSGPFDLLVANAVGQSTISPLVVTPHVQGPLGQNGWYTGDVTVTWDVSDPSAITSGCGSATISTDTPGVTLVCTATNAAGPVSKSVTIRRDATAPALHVSGAPDGTVFSVCSGPPARPTFAPTDNLSGLDGTQADSWSTSGGVGTYVYSAHATDNAGNTSTETRAYAAVYGDAGSGGAFGGFVAPLAPDSSRRVKLGSTLPVKFTLACGPLPIASASAHLVLKPADGSQAPGSDVPISDGTGAGGSFQYVGGRQYQLNLSTRAGFAAPDGSAHAYTPGLWTLSVLLGDGTTRSVNVFLVP